MGVRDANGRVLIERPVWSPDGQRLPVDELVSRPGGRIGQIRRLLCTVQVGGCRAVGSRPQRQVQAPGQTDLVGWQTTDGPIVAQAPRAQRFDIAPRRCADRARNARGTTWTVRGLFAPTTFGSPARLRVPLAYGVEERFDTTPAGAAVVQDGTLLFDHPDTRTQESAVRCSRREMTWTTRTRSGMGRLRLRHAGRTTTLPRPTGLRRGDGVVLVPLSDGGAVVVSRDETVFRVPLDGGVPTVVATGESVGLQTSGFFG